MPRTFSTVFGIQWELFKICRVVYDRLEKKMQPTPVFLPGKSHGQRSLAGYSPWSCRVRHDWATSTSLHRICNTKIESEWKLWPLGGFLCQYRSITSKYLVKDVDNQGTTLVEDVDGEGGYAFVGTGVTWETSVPASQFYCETKTALKRGLIKK